MDKYNKERRLLAKLLPLDTPFSIIIDVSSKCNFKCNFCFHSIDDDELEKMNFIPSNMNFELFRKIIDQISQFHSKLKNLNLFFRGEPLLNPSIAEMIAYSKKKNIAESINITTNGFLLSPEMNMKLINAGLDSLRVSIEALTTEKYKEITGVNVEFDKFVENIKHFYLNKGKCKLTLKILDNGFDSNDNRRFYRIFREICDNAIIEQIIPMYDRINYMDIQTNYEKDLHGNELKEVMVCWQPFIYLYVLHNGDVCVCCKDYIGKISFGNINNNTLVDIWNSQSFKNFRLMHLQKNRKIHTECGKCNFPNYNTYKEDILDIYSEELLTKFALQEH